MMKTTPTRARTAVSLALVAMVAGALTLGATTHALAQQCVVAPICSTSSPSPSPDPTPTASGSHSPTPTQHPTPTPTGSASAPVIPFPFPSTFPTFSFPTTFPTQAFQPGARQSTPALFSQQPAYGQTTQVGFHPRSGSGPNNVLRALLLIVVAAAGALLLRRARVRRWMVGI